MEETKKNEETDSKSERTAEKESFAETVAENKSIADTSAENVAAKAGGENAADSEDVIRCFIKVDAARQREIQKNLYRVFLGACIVGAAGLLAYIVLGTFIEEPWVDALLAFAVPFGVGLVFTIAMKNNEKNLAGQALENFYEFGETEFTVETRKEGVFFAKSALKYSDLKKVRLINGHYLLYASAASAFAVKAEDLSGEDRDKLIERLCRAGVKGAEKLK